jgi:hypothetical protein
LMSTTKGSISRFSDPARVCMDRPCLLEFEFSTLAVETHDAHEDSESERELEDSQGPIFPSSVPSLLPPPHQTSRVDWDVVDGLFRSGLKDFMDKGHDIFDPNKSRPLVTALPPSSDVDSSESLAATTAWASDAAWIQDVGCTGAPWLAGACRGFGFDLVPGSSASASRPSSSSFHHAKGQR